MIDIEHCDADNLTALERVAFWAVSRRFCWAEEVEEIEDELEHAKAVAASAGHSEAEIAAMLHDGPCTDAAPCDACTNESERANELLMRRGA